MSRDKQIEEMAENIKSVEHKSYQAGGTFLRERVGFTHSQVIAEHLYNAGYRKQSEWISVEERLPEEGGTYLVVLKEKHECEKEWNYHVDVASFTFEWDCIFHDWDEGQGIEITHWMPLPEPPKKGGGEG